MRRDDRVIVISLVACLIGLTGALIECAGCATSARPIETQTTTYVAERATCELPPVPTPPNLVGYPSATTIYVTMDDVRSIVSFVEDSRRWMRALSQCLSSYSSLSSSSASSSSSAPHLESK